MRGSVAHQVHLVFETVKEFGTSKHEAKAEARAEGARTWHEIGKQMGVKSYATLDAYRDVAKDCLRYAKEELGVKDIEKLSGAEMKAILESKIEDGVAHATLSKYSAALEKLEVALNRYAVQHGTGREYSFSQAISEARATGKELDRFEGSRAYSAPRELVEAVRGEDFRLAAALQQEGGARVNEATYIHREQLRGLRPDVQTGQMKGMISIQGKGGKMREIAVTPATYAKLEQAVEGGLFKVSPSAYREELKNAASVSGQKYQGTHGLRWSWAQNRHQELQQHGKTYEQSIGQVSREMGHERADITEHYLR